MTHTPMAIRTPLRRSEIGVMRPPATPLIIANNDEEERRARRKTIMQNQDEAQSMRIEDSETLKNCMQMFADNKMNKDNVWSLSIIDTLSNLMSSHHRALTNFKVAGSSLEASSRVYGLRVDCVHTDVLRLSHGLNKKKVIDIDAEPDIDQDGGNDGGNEEGGNGEGGDNQADQPAQKKKKRPKRQTATVTKNPDTINGKFDTTPLADPIWGKFNSVIGGVNSPNHFLQNILFSEGGGLKMTSNYNYWDKEDPEEHSEKLSTKEMTKLDQMDIAKFESVKLDDCVLRAVQTGYKVCNVPATFDELLQNNDKPDDIEIDDDDMPMPPSPLNTHDVDDNMAMAFDMDAEVEPVPTEDFAVLNVDIGDITVEEQEAINLCKGLKKKSVVIEDLRPINSNILEYSYRPLESINRYWAGPSHWNFRNFRKTLAPVQPNSTAGGKENQTVSIRMNAERMKNKSIRNRPKQLNFTQMNDDLFQKLDESKLKKTILSKKWDAKKLKLPTNYTYPPNFFDKYTLAPNLSARRFRQEDEDEENNNLVTENVMSDINDDDDNLHFDTGGDDIGGNMSMSQSQGGVTDFPTTQDVMGGDANKTIMEISDNFVGAPDKVTRIVVPFAKRAKVIDMKQLKRCGLQSINNQLVDSRDQDVNIIYRNEKYLPGIATFSGIYNKLPTVLSKTMAEGLTPSVALYSVLHLCNENNFRIFPQEDLKDFKIRKVQ